MRSSRRAAGIVGLAVFGSRLMGLVREQVFAGLFGAGKLLDAFLAAFQIPNLLRDLFAEGALSTAFTTTFTRTWEKEGSQEAWRLTSLLLTAVLIVVGAACLLGIALSPLLVDLTSHGFRQVGGKYELTVQLTRTLFPFILCVSLASVVMGVLNARYVFGLPASASTVFNLVSVCLGVVLAYAFEPQADWRHPHFTARALHGVTLAVLAGGLAQLLVQWPALRRQGYRFRWTPGFRDPKLRAVWRLMWPSLIAGSAVQVNVLVNGLFASEIDGARSWLNCAFRLMQFPIGLFGVAVATATLPAVARHHARRELGRFGQTVNESLRLALFLTLPAAAGLFALAPEIIRLIYQHGRFTALDTLLTANALRAYSLGLCGYAMLKVLAPCFYALDRPRTPLRVSLQGIGINLGLNLLLVKALGYGHVGLASSTAVLATVNGLQLLLLLHRHVDCGRGGAWVRFLGALIPASLACGWGSRAAVGWFGAPPSVMGQTVQVVTAVAVGAAIFLGLATILRIQETTVLARAARNAAGRMWDRLASGPDSGAAS